eukprot:TRINITY_DN1802_c1_g1_i1.p1 TRINITY_DN1802_c1_g1~~TRINITY_DN1802_c1_g1_i1.p1  ORF type:complete len:323 (+),score=65.59 TRINITY_DN1802_c1_g1_i1:222-1190(+)
MNTYLEELESPTPESKKNDPDMKLPPVGMGSYVGDLFGHTSPDHGRDMAYEGIKAGFRLIDCAMYYQNEETIGLGIQDAISEGVVVREDLFVCTKVAHPNVERTNYKDSPYVADPDLDATSGVYNDVKKSVENLSVGPIDLVLLHWPGDFDGTDADLAKAKRIAMWRGLEQAKEDGLVKSIGVSNFTLFHYDQLLESELKHYPAATQIEVNPYIPNTELVLGCQKRGMEVMAYCPLGGAKALKEELLVTMAETLSTTPANIILSWLAGRSIVPIPQSTKPERLASNFLAVMEPVELSRENIEKLAQLADPDMRICPNPANIL